MIYVDTSFWAAWIWSKSDHHAEAVQLYRRYRDRVWVTHRLVLAETWTLVNVRAGHKMAVRVLDSIAETATTIVDAVDHQQVVAWLRRRDERMYSYVDAVSFQTMRALGIWETLTFDDDFDAAGFVRLRASM